jgi:hypothetical protein
MVDGREAMFGASGALWRDALVMYDRETGSYWSQINATAIDGPRQGDTLQEIPSMVTTWGEWKKLHPHTLALEKPALESTPYDRYYASEERYGIFGRDNPDDRLPGKELVVGVREAGAAAAVRLERLQEAGVINGAVGGTPVAWVAAGGLGAGAFERRLDGRSLELALDGQGRLIAADPVEGDETPSAFDPVSGEAVSGPLAGRKLRRLAAMRVYWYSWASFHPDTEIVEP